MGQKQQDGQRQQCGAEDVDGHIQGTVRSLRELPIIPVSAPGVCRRNSHH